MKNYIKFLPSYDNLISFGFTDEEIIIACNDAEVIKEDLCKETTCKILPQYKHNLLKDNYKYKVIKKVWNDKYKCYQKEEIHEIGFLIEERENIIIESKIISHLFLNKFSWMTSDILKNKVLKHLKPINLFSLEKYLMS